MNLFQARLLLVVYRLGLFMSSCKENMRRWFDRYFPIVVAALFLIALGSFYAAESVMCSSGIGSCTFANNSLGNWLFPK